MHWTNFFKNIFESVVKIIEIKKQQTKILLLSETIKQQL